MTEQEIKTIVAATVEDMRSSVMHEGCPWLGVDAEKIAVVKQVPHGAFRMVMATWNVFNKFGQSCGNAIAAGAFIVLIALLCVGGIFLFKLGEFAMSFGK